MLAAVALAVATVLVMAVVVLPSILLTNPSHSAPPSVQALPTRGLETTPAGGSLNTVKPPTIDAAARLEATRLRIIDTWTVTTALSETIRLDFEAGDYTSGIADAKAMSKIASDELKWLAANPAHDCYESVWSYWRSGIVEVGTAAGLASAFFEGLPGTSPSDIEDMQIRLQASITAMTALVEELPRAQQRCGSP